ncbi:hypothetical protein E2C01_078741 [Portunus trituberculatus]|uniref:Uncharacterized protein n=1 Tax=Portunus trituberculatus TaxID=210409 RepID=A0A5B7IR14_PORTR|nr:hypothetical protein [Portunus trituberculatus]
MHLLHTLPSLKIYKMVTPNTASEFPSVEGTINVPRSECSSDSNPKFFFINFCNIRGLRSNFQSVELYLSSAKPHLLFLTESQLCEATDSSPYSVPSYFLHPHFRSKAGCCFYVHNDLTCSLAHALESFEFSTIWLGLISHSLLNLSVLSVSPLTSLTIVNYLTI